MLAPLLLAACVFEDARPVVHVASSARSIVEEALRDEVAIDAGATPTLVQHVIEGAPGVLLVSADPRWTQDLQDRHLALEVWPVARNRLVLAAPPGSPPPGLAQLDTAPCVVIGEPRSVPLGRYTSEALTKLGKKGALDRATTTGDAAAAVAAVASGACPIGVLYVTDAVAPTVVAGAPLPDAVQPRILVEVVLLEEEGRPYAARLRDPAVWTRHGFLPP